MQKVLTAAEMREVDRLTTERYGLPSIILMENAAHAVVRAITEKLDGPINEKSILVLCGKGNNGGDGAAAARILWTLGARVNVYLIGALAQTQGDAKSNFEILKALGRPSLMIEEIESSVDLFESMASTQRIRGKFDVIVDALFGTGVKRPLDPPYSEIINGLAKIVKELSEPPLIVSVDLPSGLDSDSSALPDSAFRADVTVTFSAPKPANVLAPAAALNGELIVADIGSPSELTEEQMSNLYVTGPADLRSWLKRTEFSNSSYKNKRGHALIIAGSENYSGAAVLCGNAAIRSGAGLVTIGAPRSSKDSIAARVVPEVIVRPLSETDTGSIAEEAIIEIGRISGNVDAIAIGSGLTAHSESTGRLVRRIVNDRAVPMVLDADALTLLSPFGPEEIQDEKGPPLILTPHQGEFLRMLGSKEADLVKGRVAAVREFAQKHRAIVVLKGERCLIAEPGGRVVVNPTGNSGLGKAGNGDTLTGMIVGFAAQASAMDVDMFETVAAAVYAAGLAGDIAEMKYGKRVMTASDVRECLADAFEAVNRSSDTA